MRELLAMIFCASLLASAAAAELSDPTRPALMPPPPVGLPMSAPPRLRSVLVSGERRVAVIDGRRVEVGDRVDGARVVAIELSGVRLRRAGVDVFLSLSGGGFKTPTSPKRNQP